MTHRLCFFYLMLNVCFVQSSLMAMEGVTIKGAVNNQEEWLRLLTDSEGKFLRDYFQKWLETDPNLIKEIGNYEFFRNIMAKRCNYECKNTGWKANCAVACQVSDKSLQMAIYLLLGGNEKERQLAARWVFDFFKKIIVQSAQKGAKIDDFVPYVYFIPKDAETDGDLIRYLVMHHSIVHNAMFEGIMQWRMEKYQFDRGLVKAMESKEVRNALINNEHDLALFANTLKQYLSKEDSLITVLKEI